MTLRRSGLKPKQNSLEIYTLSTLLAFGLLLSLLLILATIFPAGIEFSHYDSRELLSGLHKWVAPEPLERTLYILLTLSAVGVCALSTFLARFILERSKNPLFIRYLSHGLSSLCLLSPIAIILCIPYFSITRTVFEFSSPYACSLWVSFATAFIIAVISLKWPPRDCPTNRLCSWCAGVSLIAFVIISSIWRFFGHGSVTMDWVFLDHFGPLIFPQSQVLAGKTIFIDFPSQYGGFVEMLRPWFKLVGLSVFSFSATLSAMVAVAIACLLVFLRRYVNSLNLLILGSATVVLSCSIWYTLVFGFEPYFQYTPVRLICPAMALLLFDRRSNKVNTPYAPSFAFFVGIFCGFSVSWNIDSGVVVVGTWFAIQFLELARSNLWRHVSPDHSRERTTRIICLFTTLAGLALFLLLFAINVYWQSGQWVTASDILHLQGLFYSVGFNMQPMPRMFHPWMLVVGVYIVALILGIEWALGHLNEPRLRPILILSIMGLGLFSYYQGRSHDFNLILVLWPATLILFLLAQSALELYKTRQVGFPHAFSLVASAMSLGALAMVQVSRGIPTLLELTEEHIKEIRHPKSHTSESISFIESVLQGSKDCGILANHHAIYQAELGLSAPWKGPGLAELLLKSDIKSINQQFLKAPPEHLVVGPFSHMGPESNEETVHLGKIISTQYRLVSQNNDASLYYYKRN